MTKLTIRPQQSNYSLKRGKEVVRQQLDGGRGRYRKDIENPSLRANCTWLLNRFEYDYINAFFISELQGGSLPFTIDMILESGTELVECTANFIPGSFGLTSVSGLVYTVSAELEIEPQQRDDEANRSLVALFNTFGNGSQAFIDALDILVNTTMPNNL